LQTSEVSGAATRGLARVQHWNFGVKLKIPISRRKEMPETEPKLEQRDAQPTVGITVLVSMAEVGSVLPPLIGEITGWLKKMGVTACGAPFFRYLVIDMEKNLEIEVGFPVDGTLPGEGRIQPSALPAGCYATVLHTGPYKNLRPATARLLEWAEKNGITWQTSARGEDLVWDARLEFYLSDPGETDEQKLLTELAFLTTEKRA
jgi:effector-binding domain-containing protein